MKNMILPKRLGLASVLCLLLLPLASPAAAWKYSVVPNFFQEDPGGQQLGPCHGGVVIDKAGEILVTTDTPRGIVAFSSKGKFLRSFGPTRIHGLEIRREKGGEFIYGARPADHEVVKVDMKGNELWSIKYPEEAGIYQSEKNFKPCAVTVGPDGSIFVADGYGANYVLKFDKNRKFIKAFGGPGEEEGKFKTCHGITVDTRQGKPLLLICNRNNNRVEYWDLDGNFIKVIQKDLRMPAAVMIRGKYAVFPELQGRVSILDKDGNIVARIGDNPNEKQRANFPLPKDQWTVGFCNSPHGAVLDRHFNVIETEWSKFGRVQKFELKK
ncbi:MAG TPA: 6-bladed beta-propeller [Verrucomicrobiae bacterium]|nr:6-bladed beta-propeller [Verrucomicrobiae bacterium]